MTQTSPTRDGPADLLRRRIVVAPMAGGPTTTGLVIAAARAGALGFLAAGYKTLCVQGYGAGAHRGTFGNDDAAGRGRSLL